MADFYANIILIKCYNFDRPDMKFCETKSKIPKLVNFRAFMTRIRQIKSNLCEFFYKNGRFGYINDHNENMQKFLRTSHDLFVICVGSTHIFVTRDRFIGIQ